MIATAVCPECDSVVRLPAECRLKTLITPFACPNCGAQVRLSPILVAIERNVPSSNYRQVRF